MTFAGSSINIKTLGLGQSNVASPAGWCVISIVKLRAHGAKGHGAQFIAPMSLVRRSLLAILYVDDTGLLHINMDAVESIYEVHIAIQSAIANWGELLIATGESLNSLTAIDGHDRQYFNELRSTVVSRRIFIRSQSLIAR